MTTLVSRGFVRRNMLADWSALSLDLWQGAACPHMEAGLANAAWVRAFEGKSCSLLARSRDRIVIVAT
jgi:hypothetical protein